MTCQDARNLFDAHLDGELSTPLETELGAHLVECSACRRELALLEVAGHVIGTDARANEISDSFSDRLLACLEEPPTHSFLQFRGVVKWSTAILAAAASLVLMIGWFSGRPHYIAGKKERVVDPASVMNPTSPQARQANLGQSANPATPWLSHSAPPPKQELSMSDWSKLTIVQLLDALGFEENSESTKKDDSPIHADDSIVRPQPDDPQIEDL